MSVNVAPTLDPVGNQTVEAGDSRAGLSVRGGGVDQELAARRIAVGIVPLPVDPVRIAVL